MIMDWRWCIHVIKFQNGIREIFFSFQGGLTQMYRIYRKILNSDQGDFQILVKSGGFRRNFKAHFREPPGRSGRVHMYVMIRHTVLTRDSLTEFSSWACTTRHHFISGKQVWSRLQPCPQLPRNISDYDFSSTIVLQKMPALRGQIESHCPAIASPKATAVTPLFEGNHSQQFPCTVRTIKKSLPCTFPPLSPTLPQGGGGTWLQTTGA